MPVLDPEPPIPSTTFRLKTMVMRFLSYSSALNRTHSSCASLALRSTSAPIAARSGCMQMKLAAFGNLWHHRPFFFVGSARIVDRVDDVLKEGR